MPSDADWQKLVDEGKDLYFYGVPGGNVYLDSNTKDLLSDVDKVINITVIQEQMDKREEALTQQFEKEHGHLPNGTETDDMLAADAEYQALEKKKKFPNLLGLAGIVKPEVGSAINAIIQVNSKTESGSGEPPLNEDTTLNLNGYKDKDWMRYYGAVGGDAALNLGLTGSIDINADVSGSGLSVGQIIGNEPLEDAVDIHKEYQEAAATVINRYGNANIQVGSDDGSVSVLGGIGGSAAMAVGNMTADMSEAAHKEVTVKLGDFNQMFTGNSITADITANLQNVTLQGNTTTTIHGNVNTTVHQDANVVGWMNGGLAAAVGGNATSTVTGNTDITIDGSGRRTDIGKETPDDNPYEKDSLTHGLDMMKTSGVNAIGVIGGGAAVTTNGGVATSTVGTENGAEDSDTTNITIRNATVIGAIGGGAAASVDATGVLEQVYKPGGQELQLGKNNGDADINGDQIDAFLAEKGVFTGTLGSLLNNELVPDDLTITATEAVNGGTATSTVENDTNISITGTSTAAGVLGGGAAVAAHTYTIRSEKDGAGKIPDGYSVNDEYGTSVAKAETGKSHITINLEKQLADWGIDPDDGVTSKQEMLVAVKAFASQLTDSGKPMTPDVLKEFSNQGAAIGVFGGGAAVAQSGNRQFLDENDTLKGQGAYATATTDGAEINLLNGYIAGVMGGGVAGTINNATAAANMTGTVDITVGGNYVDDDGVTQKGEPEVVGVFGNGLAYFTGSTATPGDANGDTIVDDDMNDDGEKGDVETVFAHLKGTATASAKDTNINVRGGTVDGVIGGGMAIDDSDAAQTNAIVETSGKATINVTNGTVKTVNAFAGLNEVLGEVDPTKKPDIGAYVDGVKAAAGNAAIAAGGIALGGGAEATVANAEVNIAGGTVSGDVYGGGIAAYGYTETDGETKGSHVGNTTINLLDGGKVEGNIYAGGAAATKTSGGAKVYSGYDQAIATVDTATVNLAGADVTGILYGTGTVNAGTEHATVSENDGSIDSTLNLTGENTLSLVNGASKIQKFDTVYAKAGSVTKVEGLTAGTGAALIDGGKVTVEDGAKLDVTGLEKTDAAYHIVANATEDSTYWKNSNLVYDRTEGYAVGSTATGATYDVTYSELTEENAAAAAKDMVEALNAGPFESMIEDANRKQWAEAKGITAGGKQFFSDWSSKAPGMNEAYGRAAMIGEDAAVTGNTVSIARDMADNVMQRLSFTDDYVQDAGWVNNDGGIWAKYIHRKYETDNMGSSFGGIHSSTDYDGAIVGVDFAKHGNFQSGVAFHYGSGDGNGLISRNDYDAWGFTLYGSLKDEEAGTNLMADVGYVTSDNDIDGTVNGKSLSADRDVDAWTIGLRGEKEYVFGQNQLVPYVGLRYMSVNPARYSVYYDGAKAFNADADNQNLWLLPIGVSFRNETVTDGGWRITPKLDLSYIWAFGDTDTDMTLDMGGVGSGLYYDVMDDNSWLASLGVEATKDVWSFGVGYGYQKGDDTKNKTWFVNASYAF